MPDDNSPLVLRDALIVARQRFGQGQITVDSLYAAADAYIDALRQYKRTAHKRMAIPSRAYLIRAIG
jgi:hypothetical protein